MKEFLKYFKTKKKIICHDSIKHIWPQETISYHKKKKYYILVFIEIKIKNSDLANNPLIPGSNPHLFSLGSYSFPNPAGSLHFLKCIKDQLYPPLLTAFIPLFTLFLHPRPLLHCPFEVDVIFFPGLLYWSGRILNPWVTPSP